MAIKKRRFITAIPVAFYTPETRLGLGASGLMLFNFKTDSINAPRSSVSIGFAYTQNKQVLFNLPYNLFVKNREYHFYGEIAYHKFFYNFYGVGNDEPIDYVEKFGVKFPRLRITALKKIIPHFYAGLRYVYDNYTTFDLDSTGQLADGTIPGSQGCIVSGFGLVTMIDTRDNIFYPRKGMWAEFVVFNDNQKLGATYNYVRLAFDLTKIISFQKNIFAFNVYSIYSTTDVPFFQMGSIGGAKKMRGFYEGRYRDNNLIMFQAEYRRHLFWLLGFTLFADMAQVAHRYDAFNADYWRYTYGAGLRLQIDKTQKINLRFDVAVGNGKVLPYFTIGEAF
jgi:outer membrane protein assembly factor BamA